MWLDLKDLIEVPGAVKAFTVELDTEQLLSPSILAFRQPLQAVGTVQNTAGLLYLNGSFHADMRCVCDRCGREFDREKSMDVRVPLTAAPEGEDDGDAYPLEGDGIDASRVLETCFLLDTEPQMLCKPDCRGLCPRCGKNLNDGPCGCETEIDPRFAVLKQLLDNPQRENKI